MVSPHKPVTTYSRKSNSRPLTAAAALDPDALLQEKIRKVLQNDPDKQQQRKRFSEEAEEDFDSAYIEGNVRRSGEITIIY